MERCPSGLRCTLGKRVWRRLHRGFKSRPLRKNNLNFTKSLLILFFTIVAVSFSKERIIATAFSVSGEIQMISSEIQSYPTRVISGNSIKSDDILRSSKDGDAVIVFNDNSTLLRLDKYSEIKLNQNSISRTIYLNFGTIYVENNSQSKVKTFVFTPDSQIEVSGSSLWIENISGKGDKIHILDGSSKVLNDTNGKSVDIESETLFCSYNNGYFEKEKFLSSNLPAYLQDGSMKSKGYIEPPLEIDVKNFKFRNHDLIPIYTGKHSIAEKYLESLNTFGVNLSAGYLSVYDFGFSKISISPYYKSRHWNVLLRLDSFVSTSDSLDFNSVDDVFDILHRIRNLRYVSDNGRFFFQIGELKGISFGHGHLVKEYTNALDYPRTRTTGMYLRYLSDSRNFTLDAFASSLRDLFNGGGLVGVHATTFISSSFPLTVGLGYVSDLNQYAAIGNFYTKYESWSSNKSRIMNSAEVDLTYDLLDRKYYKYYLFFEGVGMWFPEKYYYVRVGRNNIEGQSLDNFGLPETVPMGFNREGSWGITGPGLWVKYRHLWDLKIALQMNSALHIPQYFNTTYEFERVRYANYEFIEPDSELDNLMKLYESYELEEASNEYLLPKELYSKIDGTQNIFPTIGFNFEYDFHYRESLDFHASLSVFKEYSDVGDEDVFYNYNIDVTTADGMFKGISEGRLYYSQFFTNQPFDNKYHENLLRGFQVGIKLTDRVSFFVDFHDIFFDKDMDGDVDKISTKSFELKADL